MNFTCFAVKYKVLTNSINYLIHKTYNMKHITYNIKLKTYNIKHITYDMKLITHNVNIYK